MFSDEVHGFWLFILGVVLSLAGFLVFLTGSLLFEGDAVLWSVRQTAAFLGGIGLPLILLGSVRQFPVKKISDVAAVLGVAVCLSAVVAFAVYYPTNWNVSPESTSIDYSLHISSVYAVGVLFIVLPAFSRAWEEGFKHSEKPSDEEMLESRVSLIEDELQGISGAVYDIENESQHVKERVDELDQDVQKLVKLYEEALVPDSENLSATSLEGTEEEETEDDEGTQETEKEKDEDGEANAEPEEGTEG